MNDENSAQDDQRPLSRSVNEVEPDEHGGPTARRGFSYQDEIAVWFLIALLVESDLIEVHCETHDDIVLIWQDDEEQDAEGPTRVVEFVQVKAGEADSLWSVAELCRRKSGDVPHSSLFETTLLRDKHQERSRFRIITSREVVSDLKPLTFNFSAPGRAPKSKPMADLRNKLEQRRPDCRSQNGNGHRYWLENCLWEVRFTKEVVKKDNLIRLAKFSRNEGCGLVLEQVEEVLDGLRTLAREAGDASWASHRDTKIITRNALHAWWRDRVEDVRAKAKSPSGDKLELKMRAAGLTDEQIALAQELRRDYAAEMRAPRYLEIDDAHRLARSTRSALVSLRAGYVSAADDENGKQFHTRCLGRLDEIAGQGEGEPGDREAFMKGCMYDVTDRCLHRFDRPSP